MTSLFEVKKTETLRNATNGRVRFNRVFDTKTGKQVATTYRFGSYFNPQPHSSFILKSY